MGKETAIDWLYECLKKYDSNNESEYSMISINKGCLKYLIEQAKIIERIQIQNSFSDGKIYGKEDINKYKHEYYKETYNQ